MARWLLLFCLLPTWAGAGYYVQVTASPSGTVAVGTQSQCYLTPSMAWASLVGGGTKVISSVNTDTQSITGTFSGSSVTTYYSECSATPLVTTMPTFLGSASDPAIQSGSIISGGSSGGGSSNALITPLAPEIAVEDSFQLFLLALGLFATIWAGKRLTGLFGDQNER